MNTNSESRTPHDVEAEQQVLGAILLDPSILSEVAMRGGDRLFYDPTHADIYKIMAKFDSDDMLVSPVTLREPLAAHEGLKQLGGAGYLAKMAGASVASSMVSDYADMLSELRAKRDLLEMLTTAQDDIMSGSVKSGDVSTRLEIELMDLSGLSTKAAPVSMMSAVTTALTNVNDAYMGKDVGLIPTGLGSLDGILGGMGKGELILMGGRPSMGKTAAALTLGLNAARAGHGVIIVSLEMTPDAMALRALSEATVSRGPGVSYGAMKRGRITEHQMRTSVEAAQEVKELPIQFLTRGFADIGTMYAGIKQAAKRLPQDKTPLVIVDYIQLMRSKANNRYEQITEISIALKGIAMQLEAPVLALSQLSRAVEQRDDKRPMLSDLRESGQLEQDADTILFCYRDEYYLERDEPQKPEDHLAWEEALGLSRGRMEIIVAKQRQGAIGTAKLRCNLAVNSIWDDNNEH